MPTCYIELFYNLIENAIRYNEEGSVNITHGS